MAVLLTLIAILCAIWIANEAEKILKTEDPGCIVIDEIAGIILTLFGLPFNIISVTAGFLVFRALDIWKPYPIRFLENKFSGGIGIVLDDVAAGILSNLILRVVIR
jgi:phosphatidylglycerophosphatase A